MAFLFELNKGQLFQPLSELLVCNSYLSSSGAVRVEMYKLHACMHEFVCLNMGLKVNCVLANSFT